MTQDATPRFGLIIQGPVRSRGLTARSMGSVTKRHAGEEWIVDFDSTDTINATVARFGGRLGGVVLATWEGEDTGRIGAGIELLKLADPTPKKIGRPRFYNFRFTNNKFRQYYSTLAGLRALQAGGRVDVAIKIRTDQAVDLGLLIDYLVGLWRREGRLPDSIFVPHLLRSSLVLQDFYFAGNLSSMVDYFSCLVEDDFLECAQHVHSDLVLKYALKRRCAEIGVPLRAYFPYSTELAELQSGTARIYRHLYAGYFRPLPEAIYATLVWRGERFTPDWLATMHDDGLFAEREGGPQHRQLLAAIDSAYGDRMILRSLVRTNWPLYARFRVPSMMKTNPLARAVMAQAEKLSYFVLKCNRALRKFGILRRPVVAPA